MMSLPLYEIILDCVFWKHSHYLFLMFSENRIKAVQLDVMRALVEVMTLHKADANVSKSAACAFRAIFYTGV